MQCVRCVSSSALLLQMLALGFICHTCKCILIETLLHQQSSQSMKTKDFTHIGSACQKWRFLSFIKLALLLIWQDHLGCVLGTSVMATCCCHQNNSSLSHRNITCLVSQIHLVNTHQFRGCIHYNYIF